MTFINENTSREEMVAILTADLDSIQFCIDHNIDPEDAAVSTADIRKTLIDFIQAGDECAAS